MTNKELTVKEFEEMEGEPEHGQVVLLKHNKFIDYFVETNEPCDGVITWDSAMEGLVCSKCNLYTGVK